MRRCLPSKKSMRWRRAWQADRTRNRGRCLRLADLRGESGKIAQRIKLPPYSEAGPPPVGKPCSLFSNKTTVFYFIRFNMKGWNPLTFYTGATTNQQIVPSVSWRSRTAAKMFLLGSDYVFPRTANKIIKAQLTAEGGKLAGGIHAAGPYRFQHDYSQDQGGEARYRL